MPAELRVMRQFSPLVNILLNIASLKRRLGAALHIEIACS
jgi:hypothetical protein